MDFVLNQSEMRFLQAAGRAGPWRSGGIFNGNTIGRKVGLTGSGLTRVVWNLCRKRLITSDGTGSLRLTLMGREQNQSQHRAEKDNERDLGPG